MATIRVRTLRQELAKSDVRTSDCWSRMKCMANCNSHAWCWYQRAYGGNYLVGGKPPATCQLPLCEGIRRQEVPRVRRVAAPAQRIL